MPAVALFLGHDASGCVAVVVGGRRGEEVTLLFDRSEFGVALDGDHADEGVTHALVGHLERALPLGTAFVVTEFDDVAGALPVKLDGEVEVAHPLALVSDGVLPLLEIVNPVVPCLR